MKSTRPHTPGALLVVLATAGGVRPRRLRRDQERVGHGVVDQTEGTSSTSEAANPIRTLRSRGHQDGLHPQAVRQSL